MMTFAKDEKFTKYAKSREINFWQAFAKDLTEFSKNRKVSHNVEIAHRVIV